MSLVFILVFAAGAAPFWALMVLAPKWAVTQRISASPWIFAPSLVFWFVFALPNFIDVLPVYTNPRLADWQDLLTDPAMLIMVWGQIIAWDLFVGRWIYLDSRSRNAHPLVMGPLLVLAIVLSPIALPLYLLLRPVLTRGAEQAETAAAVKAPVPA
jgi:hypothetical protein